MSSDNFRLFELDESPQFHRHSFTTDISELVFSSGVYNLRKFWVEHAWRVENPAGVKQALSNSRWVDELFFCLLGGYGISYESNKIAFNVLRSAGVFTREFLFGQKRVEACILSLLSAPMISDAQSSKTFLYRFPKVKSKTIYKAAIWLESALDWDFTPIRRLNPSEARRQMLLCPGVGMKTASWFLRNVGHGNDLAIIDVHIDRISKRWGLIPYGLSPKNDYLEMEELLIKACRRLDTSIEIVDLILWQYARGNFNSHGSSQIPLF